jgi:small nuclear ribonucleoprotein (snRNP)-like protein
MIRQDYIDELRSHAAKARKVRGRLVEIDAHCLLMLLQEIETSRLEHGLRNGVRNERNRFQASGLVVAG